LNLNPAVDRSFLVWNHDPQRLSVVLDVHLIWRVRYSADCAIFAAHGCVATPWNGMVIVAIAPTARCCALPRTLKTAHSTFVQPPDSG